MKASSDKFIIQFCGCASPDTGQLCTMGKGHVGPHQVGGPYHTVESFVTRCTDEEGCIYHGNSKYVCGPKGREISETWQQCIKCGHIKEPFQLKLTLK